MVKDAAWEEPLVALVQMLAPFAPHMSEELWQQLDQEGSVHTSQWPEWDEALLAADTITIAVQVNGKIRGEVQVPADADEATVVAAAKSQEKVASYLADHEVKKSIYVPKKLVSFVI